MPADSTTQLRPRRRDNANAVRLEAAEHVYIDKQHSAAKQTKISQNRVSLPTPESTMDSITQLLAQSIQSVDAKLVLIQVTIDPLDDSGLPIALPICGVTQTLSPGKIQLLSTELVSATRIQIRFDSTSLPIDPIVARIESQQSIGPMHHVSCKLLADWS